MNSSTFVSAVIVLGALSATVFGQATTAPTTKPPAEAKMKLFLLIGQSNMSGRGKIEAEDKVPHPHVWKLNEAGEWEPAVDPLHFDKPKVVGVGLGSSFGRAMADAYPDAEIGLVPCAVGGTPIRRWLKGQDLYEAALKRAKVAMQHGEFAGFLWHQGESDSQPAKTATYAEQLEAMIKDLRADLNAPDAPFVLGQLGRFRDEKSPGNKAMNEVLTKFPETHPNTACASTEGLTSIGDNTHFDSKSLREFGKRYAEAYLKLAQAAHSSSDTSPANADK